jgi:ribose-phosphate pyrophosphokinase
MSDVTSVTAIADKLGVEFALIHRKRNGKSLSAPEHMEILVGDVRDKVRWQYSSQVMIL